MAYVRRARRSTRRMSTRSARSSGGYRRSASRSRRTSSRRGSVQTLRLVIDTARPSLMPTADGNPLAGMPNVGVKKPRF